MVKKSFKKEQKSIEIDTSIYRNNVKLSIIAFSNYSVENNYNISLL